MAKTKTKSKHSRNSSEAQLHGTNRPLVKSKPQKPIATLLAEAATHLTQSQPDLALPLATSAITRLTNDPSEKHVSLPAALCLLAEIQLELGDADAARTNYQKAVSLDPEKTLGAEVWFSLAQLSEVGGQESIKFYENGTQILRAKIQDAPEEFEDEEEWILRLGDALCAMVEVYMTDLSWEDDAEQRCEMLVTEAVALCPDRPGVLQTLANVRISQERDEEARNVLRTSMESWNGPLGKRIVDGEVVDAEDEGTLPEFAIRISLVRLLMDVGMEQEAVQVCERLVSEDDESVEGWYLNGWGRMLLAEKTQDDEECLKLKKSARESLATALRLYQQLDYEDDRLRDHALELVQGLGKEVGTEDDDWEDEDEDEEVGSDDEEVEFNGFDPDPEQDHDGDVNMT
jgi:tetratricopeptide (TPR) repeat protein